MITSTYNVKKNDIADFIIACGLGKEIKLK